ncbi:hypothetical protein GCM10027091_42660 [Streptomyces daliensis]
MDVARVGVDDEEHAPDPGHDALPSGMAGESSAAGEAVTEREPDGCERCKALFPPTRTPRARHGEGTAGPLEVGRRHHCGDTARAAHEAVPA